MPRQVSIPVARVPSDARRVTFTTPRPGACFVSVEAYLDGHGRIVVEVTGGSLVSPAAEVPPIVVKCGGYHDDRPTVLVYNLGRLQANAYPSREFEPEYGHELEVQPVTP